MRWEICEFAKNEICQRNFSGIFPKICVADLQGTISKNTFFWFCVYFFLYFTGRKIYSLFVLLDT